MTSDLHKLEKKREPSTLDETLLAAATRDVATVTSDGHSLQRLTSGVVIRELPTHSDARGSVIELFDPRWNIFPDPMVFSYCFTIRPGMVKGWNLHRQHEDRYCLVMGEMETVLFDTRPGSSTFGEICRIVSSEHRRQIISIPTDVWHADYNIGTSDVLVVNFPTSPYDHANPDKYRLPYDTPLIPYSFPLARGGW